MPFIYFIIRGIFFILLGIIKGLKSMKASKD